MVNERRGGRRVGTDLILSLVALGWAVGTPVLLHGAVVVSAPFFGETPSPEEMHQAEVLLYAGLACGLVLPVVGIAVAGVTARRAVVWLFAAAFALTVAVLGYVASQ